MEKQAKKLKGIETIELKIKDRDEYLKWREKILQQYEISKVEYHNELNHLLGYDEIQEK